MEYALFGADWTIGAAGPEPKKPGDRDVTKSPDKTSIALGLLTDMRMLRLPIALDDARRMTASELTEAINRAWDLDGKFDPKRERARAFGEYVRAREAIRSRQRS